MNIFIHKFVTISPKKILGKNCSEIHFAGTNLFIPFLSNEENCNLESKYSVNIKDIKSEIDAVKKTSKIIIIIGGEPCLQQLGLKSLCKYIKQQGLFIALESYGTKPLVIKHLLDNKLIDIITLKLYFPLRISWMNKINRGTLLDNNKEIIENIKKTIELLKKIKVNTRIKTYVVPSFIYRKEDILRIAREIKDIRKCVFELIPFKGSIGNKFFSSVKAPNDEFLDELRQCVTENYPNLQIK